jgi:hypothetical protein
MIAGVGGASSKRRVLVLAIYEKFDVAAELVHKLVPYVPSV